MMSNRMNRNSRAGDATTSSSPANRRELPGTASRIAATPRLTWALALFNRFVSDVNGNGARDDHHKDDRFDVL